MGALHTSIFIDKITGAVQQTFRELDVHAAFVDKASVRTNPVIEGGTLTENLALQNIQARAWPRTDWPRMIGPA